MKAIICDAWGPTIEPDAARHAVARTGPLQVLVKVRVAAVTFPTR